MKKHRKLVALLVALTFLFSIVAPAMAATPSEAEKATDKLNVLGIIEGYPDGSFGLDRNITRAEFAKVAVMAAGLGELEPLLKNTPSKFSDVPMEWFTGWINIAANQGFVKGDPDGKFRPNDNINYAEVITVLMRLLGYNDNLPGTWPANYLAKAVDLGITKGLSFDAKAPAVRGDVFVLVDKVLDTPMVDWDNEKQRFVEKVDSDGNKVKLIAKSFDGVMKSGLVADLSWDNKGKLSVEIRGIGKSDLNTRYTYKVVDNVIVTGANSFVELLGNNIEYIANEDNEIVYAAVKDTDAVTDSELLVRSDTLEIDDQEYDLADGFKITFFPQGVTPTDEDGGKLYKADLIKVVLDRNGEAQRAFVFNYPNADVVVDIDEKYVDLDSRSIKIDSKDNYVVVKNGSIVGIDELAKGDLVYYYEDVKGLDYIIIASDKTVEGTLQKANASYSKLTVDGTAYDVSLDGVLVSKDGGEKFELNGFSKEMFDTDVTMILSPAGRVAVVIADVEAAEDLYGVVVAKPEGYRVRILTAAGKTVTYDDEDYNDADLNEGELIKFKLNADGEIKSAKVIEAEYKIDPDESTSSRVALVKDYDGDGTAETKKYSFVDNPVFFGKKQGGEKWITTSWSELRKSEDLDAVDVAVVFNKSGTKVAYIAFNGEVAAKGLYGVVMDSGYEGKGFYYTLATKGTETVTYYTYNDQPFTTEDGKKIGAKALVTYELSGQEIVDMDVEAPTDSGKVEEVGSDYVKLANGEFYDISADTVIVDITGSSPTPVRLSRGDYVQVYEVDEDNDYVEFILVVEEEEGSEGDKGTGPVSHAKYLVVDYKPGLCRLDLEDRDENVVRYYLDEDITQFNFENIEDVDQDVALAWFAKNVDASFPGAIEIKVQGDDVILTVKVNYEAEIVDVEDVDDVTVEIGTDADAALAELPEKVFVTDEYGMVHEVEVDVTSWEWDGTQYNQDEEGTYNVVGTLLLPEYLSSPSLP